jgi:hypothetical protein
MPDDYDVFIQAKNAILSRNPVNSSTCVSRSSDTYFRLNAPVYVVGIAETINQ